MSLHFNPEQLRSHFLLTGDAASAVRNRSTGVDDTVSFAYRSWLASPFPRGMALVAVGGYGRRELFPYSDIDLLLLVGKDIPGENERAAVSGFLRTLWDSGLRLSQSVRTVAECCEFDQNNVELSISLLDQRFLIGDHELYELLAGRLPKYFRSQRDNLLRHICRITQARHAKYHDTIHHLEPNIKETPGGMRDLHLVHWLSKLREGHDSEPELLKEAQEFLFGLRCKLHYKACRDNNVLTFEAQEEMSSNPAAWMREYYKHARDVYRAARHEMERSENAAETGLARSFRDWRTRLSNPEFTVSRERVFFRSPQQIASDPDLLMRLFEFVARHGIRLSLEAERRVREHLLYLEEYFAGKHPLWPALRDILVAPHAAFALRSMYDTGLLPVIFPVWEQIECLVVRDFYHRYTVDEHTLITLEYLEELRATQDTTRKKFAELLSETEHVPLLFVALLLHDIGKSAGMEGHAAESTRLAERVLERVQMPEPDRRRVLFLIDNHLAISGVMNARDLSDPATAAYLAARVGTLENLKLLALLTYADISAVNPEAMTSWRLHQLWRAYLVTHRELTRELASDRIQVGPADSQAPFLEGFPTRYLRTHTADDIKKDVALELASRETGVAVDLRRNGNEYVLTVIARDKSYLFATIAGTISSFGMDILKAEAFANARGTTLDTFVFADPLRTIELNPIEAERLRLTVQRAVLGKEDVRRLLRGRVRRRSGKLPRVQPTVAFDSEASKRATLVEVIAEDRPGLLYDLAATFSESGCSIDVVLIDTEAHKALDVFYVTKNGKKLDSVSVQNLQEQILAICT